MHMYTAFEPTMFIALTIVSATVLHCDLSVSWAIVSSITIMLVESVDLHYPSGCHI